MNFIKSKKVLLLGVCLFSLFFYFSNHSDSSYKTLFIKPIQFYKTSLSPAGSPDCYFYPSCSLYTQNCIEKYGVLEGLLLGFDRLMRCHHEDWIYPKVLVNGEEKNFDPA